MTQRLDYESVSALIDDWMEKGTLPLQPRLVAPSGKNLIVRVSPEDFEKARDYFAIRSVTVRGDTRDVLLILHTEPPPDSSMTDLYEELVGLPLPAALQALSGSQWTVAVGAPNSVRTADFKPWRLTLIASEEGIVTTIVRG